MVEFSVDVFWFLGVVGEGMFVCVGRVGDVWSWFGGNCWFWWVFWILRWDVRDGGCIGVIVFWWWWW